tara:strand:- start:46 stop:537 length:492 start_codon:yes stop_codon:yes gene_type:complete
MQLKNSKLVKDLEQLKLIVENLQLKHKTVVFTNGCFDLIHPGHIYILEQAKAEGDTLIVGLNSDESIKKFKSKSRPICNQDDRAYVLSGLSCVDYIFIFNESTPEKLIMNISPDVLVKGKDYQIKDIAGSDFMLEKKKRIKLVDIIEEKSTTNIIDQIKKTSS